MKTHNFLAVMSCKENKKVRMFYFIDNKRVSKITWKLANKFVINCRERKEIDFGDKVRISYIADIGD